MAAIADIRDLGEADLSARLRKLNRRHRQMVKDAIKRWGSVAAIPQSVWDTIEKETEQQMTLAMLLIFAASHESTQNNLGFAVSVAQIETSADEFAGTRAREFSKAYADGMRDRVRQALQDIPKQELDIAGPKAIDQIINDKRTDSAAVTETTATISSGQRKGADDFKTTNPLLNVVMLWITERDARVCPVCAPLDRKTDAVWSGQFPGGPPAHINCLVEGTLVSAARISAHYKRWFEGQIVTIRTGSGKHISVTCNHPVLTQTGWVPAGELELGNRIFESCRPSLDSAIIDPDDYQVEVPVEDVPRTLRMIRSSMARSMPTSSVDFHGDGIENEEVQIVRSTCHLTTNEPEWVKNTEYENLCRSHRAEFDLSGGRSLGPLCGADGSPPDRLVGRSGQSLAVLDCGVSHAKRHGITGGSHGQFQFDPSESECRAMASEIIGDLDATLAGHVSGVKITNIEVSEYAGHVFNLQTGSGWYFANGIIAHNCRCELSMKVEGREKIGRLNDLMRNN